MTQKQCNRCKQRTVQNFELHLNTTPDTLTADASYGSEQNYEVMEQKDIAAYVKYNYFDKEQKGARSTFNADQLHYDEAEDYVVCPWASTCKTPAPAKNKTGVAMSKRSPGTRHPTAMAAP